MHQYSKHFTIEEARMLLPDIKMRINELIKLKSELDNIGFDIYKRKFRPGFNPDTLSEFPVQYIQLTESIASIHKDGVLIKSIETGLIDFPAIRSTGEEVFLCWQNGEEDLAYWHTLNGGYKGRRPLGDF